VDLSNRFANGVCLNIFMICLPCKIDRLTDGVHGIMGPPCEGCIIELKGN